MDDIPIIDFKEAFDQFRLDNSSSKVEQLAEQVISACKRSGFFYLKNFGISEELITRGFELSNQFFALPCDVKSVYARSNTNHFGWSCIGRERVTPDRPGDYKEAFDVAVYEEKKWPPNELINGFEECFEQLYLETMKLGLRILKVMAIGLGLEPDFFASKHALDEPTRTCLRTLYYPAIQNDSDLAAGQIRCGEHTDYGTITILFQDNIGGLEVCKPDGTYIPAPPIPGTVVVNIGDLMQRWTSDKLISTKHRVVTPSGGTGGISKARQSIACFIHPDTLIECIDGSNKYPPISAKQYLMERYMDTYDY